MTQGWKDKGRINIAVEGVSLGFGKFNQGKENWVARDISVRDSGVDRIVVDMWMRGSLWIRV